MQSIQLTYQPRKRFTLINIEDEINANKNSCVMNHITGRPLPEKDLVASSPYQYKQLVDRTKLKMIGIGYLKRHHKDNVILFTFVNTHV